MFLIQYQDLEITVPIIALIIRDLIKNPMNIGLGNIKNNLIETINAVYQFRLLELIHL